MFYSQFILAKKGPLGTIWIAAHLERKLRKNQVADTDIGVSVDSILFPEVPIALRLSSHLLLGVVRIYSRKVGYLFDDCSEALLKIKQAFRSTAVDLPPEESTAPYHSITLPETFDLDDFELPDNDILQGNYVDHHISTREQITLQDTMEGVVYSTSQFGLDERFGDGDTSQVGLDLDEDLFLDKVEVAEHNGVSESDPQALIKSETPAETDASCGRTSSSNTVQVNGTRNKIEYVAANSEFDFAQAPSTPGLMEEPNLSSVQKDLPCDDHLELDDHNVAEVATERAKNASGKSDIHQTEEAMSLSEGNHLNHDIVECMPVEDGCLSGVLEMNQAKIMEATIETVGELDDPKKPELSNNGGTCNNEPRMPDVDGADGDCGKSIEVRHHEVGDEITNSTEIQDPHENVLVSNAVQLLEHPSLSGLCDAEAEACQGSLDPENLKHHVDDEQSTLACISVLHSCNSHLNPPDAVSPSYGINNNVFHTELQSEDIVPCLSEVSERDGAFLASGSSTKMQGEECHMTDAVQPEENQMLEPVLSGEILADAGKQDEKPPNAISNDNQSENLCSSMTSELPAPEKMLSVPPISVDKPEDLLLEATPEKEILEGSDVSSGGTKTSGKKRSFTESSLTVQSVNSVESFGVTKSKRTVNSVPDDDDLLTSILVGRKSSVLKLKPTPVLEVVSTKRARSASRPTVLKRKVLMDDSMVLLGDTIRQQLTNTEDIRRLRKKAPCTRVEILVIQRHFLEEGIFTEPLLSGLSEELACLHRDTFDLSGIKISNENNAHLEAVEDKECSAKPVIQHSEMEGSSRILSCRNNLNGEGLLIEDNVCIDAVNNVTDHRHSGQETLGKVADLEIQSENANIDQSAKQSVVQEEISGDFCNLSSGFVDQSGLRDETVCDDASLQMDAATLPSDKMDSSTLPSDKMDTSTLPSDNMDTSTLPSDKMDSSTLPSDKIDTSTLPSDNMDTSTLPSFPSDKMDTQLTDDITFEDMTNGKGFDGIGTPYHCSSSIGAAGSDSRAGEEISVEVSKISAPTEVGKDVPVNGLAPNGCAENFLAYDHAEVCNLAAIHVDKALEDTENEKLAVSNDNGDRVVSLRCDDKEQISSLLHNDHSNIDCAYSAGVDGDLNRASLDDADYPVYREADQPRTMDEDSASLDHLATGHSSDFHVAELVNDTEFLNVDDDDDDEVGEDDGDGMPGDKDAYLLENSGWSSRTRAVAKYLQTLFNTEAGHGRKALSVDNLLVGKTRKEASRMFFETLVLKTRDYVHVDQEMPFDNISIKPQAKLMKSIF